jgi:hypothetical protein
MSIFAEKKLKSLILSSQERKNEPKVVKSIFEMDIVIE